MSCRYKVRVAVVDLEAPPSWWQGASANSHLTANDARQLAGTTGTDTSTQSITGTQSAQVTYPWGEGRGEGEGGL